MAGRVDSIFRCSDGPMPWPRRGCARQTLTGTLCRTAARLPPEQTGWLAGARDAEVSKALALMHQRPADPWTIASLAQQAGVSRSVLAERFRHFLGGPPMAYLMRWGR